MKLYSLYKGYSWIADGLTAEEIAEFIGCTSKRVAYIATVSIEEKGYFVVFEGDYTLTKYGKIDRKLLSEFDRITSQIRELVSA